MQPQQEMISVSKDQTFMKSHECSPKISGVLIFHKSIDDRYYFAYCSRCKRKVVEKHEDLREVE